MKKLLQFGRFLQNAPLIQNVAQQGSTNNLCSIINPSISISWILLPWVMHLMFSTIAWCKMLTVSLVVKYFLSFFGVFLFFSLKQVNILEVLFINMLKASAVGLMLSECGLEYTCAWQRWSQMTSVCVCRHMSVCAHETHQEGACMDTE